MLVPVPVVHRYRYLLTGTCTMRTALRGIDDAGVDAMRRVNVTQQWLHDNKPKRKGTNNEGKYWIRQQRTSYQNNKKWQLTGEGLFWASTGAHPRCRCALPSLQGWRRTAATRRADRSGRDGHVDCCGHRGGGWVECGPCWPPWRDRWAPRVLVVVLLCSRFFSATCRLARH